MEKMRNNSKQKVETFSRILKVFEKGESLQTLLYRWKWPVEDPSWTVSPVWGWRCASHAWARPVPPPTCSKSPSPPADALKLRQEHFVTTFTGKVGENQSFKSQDWPKFLWTPQSKELLWRENYLSSPSISASGCPPTMKTFQSKLPADAFLCQTIDRESSGIKCFSTGV